MAMRKRADGIVPLCDLAAREKDECVRGGRGIAPGMAGGDTQARGIASRSSSTASPKGKPRRRRWGFLCPTKVEGVLVGAFYAPVAATHGCTLRRRAKFVPRRLRNALKSHTLNIER